MRINRYKKVNKYLNFFSNSYGFRKPYQVLVDGTFCFAALKNHVNVQDQLKHYLGDDVKLLTTRCVIIETEKLGKPLYGAMLIVKQFAVHRCGHDDKPVPGSLCFQSMIGKNNPNRYIIATQDRELQHVARNIPGTPVLYYHQKTPILEEPSKLSMKVAQERSNARFNISKIDQENISQMEQKLGLQKEEIKRKKKKKGGPNPLSCKKSKKRKSVPAQNQKSENTNKRKRRRIKIPEHVKAELFKNK